MNDTNKIVRTYVKIRDARAELKKQFEEKDAALKEQLDALQSALLKICNDTNSNGLKTDFGTVSRTVKQTYFVDDWAPLYEFIEKHKCFDFLQKRVSQKNFDDFFADNPDIARPSGVRINSEYSITVRRK